ncbi:CLUMA_CG011896, isoform A [Clunio marinus]|uniref:CLUMA_CG011896, isoform A n=1 Tax=Clunio marinus TaxID=568069 RepID=A0A1J1IJC5_9DIPT|nr:CLUMA_CG011896, isoform A [Clunio marinus]
MIKMKISSNIILKFTAIATVFGYALAQNFDTSFIKKCSRRDPQLNACLKNTFNHIKPYLVRGIPEIGVPPIEPLKLDNIGIENNAGNIRIKGSFNNVVNVGASNFTIKEIRSDLKKLRLDLGLYFPKIKSKGRYEVNGQVLLLPIVSRGEFYAEFTDVNAIGKLHGKEVIKDNETYMTVDKMVVDFVMKGARFRVKDQSHQPLNDVINQFLNQNAHELVQEMRVPASQSLAKVLKKIIDGAFVNLPMKLWLTD